MFKSILAATMAATSLFIASPEAEARDCNRYQGYTMCMDLVAQNGNYNRWNVDIQNAYTTEYMNITCYGKQLDTWQSRGGFSQSEADAVASYFCSLWASWERLPALLFFNVHNFVTHYANSCNYVSQHQARCVRLAFRSNRGR